MVASFRFQGNAKLAYEIMNSQEVIDFEDIVGGASRYMVKPRPKNSIKQLNSTDNWRKRHRKKYLPGPFMPVPTAINPLLLTAALCLKTCWTSSFSATPKRLFPSQGQQTVLELADGEPFFWTKSATSLYLQTALKSFEGTQGGAGWRYPFDPCRHKSNRGNQF